MKIRTSAEITIDGARKHEDANGGISKCCGNRLSRFLVRHPGVRADLRFTDRVVRFAEGEVVRFKLSANAVRGYLLLRFAAASGG